MSAITKPLLSDFDFSPLSADFDFNSFDCNEKDINEFLKEEALDYQSHHMANTYLFSSGSSEVIAFFCISNDCLNDKGIENTIWNRFHRKQSIPNTKRIRQYPSIKIGRLGVHVKYQGTGLAYQLMDFIKGYAVLELKPACRLLLLDSINQKRQVDYYTKNGFKFLLDDDATHEKRIMYFDLKRLV